MNKTLLIMCLCLMGSLLSSCDSSTISSQEESNTENLLSEQSSELNDSSSDITATVELNALTSLDILRLPEHPTFFGKTVDAQSIWEKYQGEDSIIIKGGITHHYKYEQAFMVLDCFEGGGAYRYTDSEFINGIQIRPENFKEDTTLSLEEAISLVEEYMPLDIMEEWYSCFETCYQDDSEGAKYYFSVYQINEDGKNKIKNKELPYSLWVSFGIRIDSSGNVQSIGISDSRIGDSRNEPEKHEWDYQLPVK